MSILIALIPMVAWGSIGLVSGKLGGDANQQTLGMTMGAFVFALVTFFIVQPAMSGWILLIGFLSGFFWSIGQNGQFHGFGRVTDLNGLSVNFKYCRWCSVLP